VVLAGHASASDQASINRATFEGQWPFTVDSGVVRCTQVESVIFIHDRKSYALNGLARSDGIYKDVREIWADNPAEGAQAGQKIDLSPVIRLGLSLCD
jgi:hypothetical protein